MPSEHMKPYKDARQNRYSSLLPESDEALGKLEPVLTLKQFVDSVLGPAAASWPRPEIPDFVFGPPESAPKI